MARFTWPEPYQVRTNGIDLAVHALGEGPVTVVLAHGFPELGYSWRYQMAPLAAAGYRVLAPDMRGYGGSSRPAAVEAYDIVQLTGDLVGLLDAHDVEKAIFIGHDWGALVTWELPALHPDRVLGLGSLNIPHRFFRHIGEEPIAYLRRTKGEGTYMSVFQQPGLVDDAFAADPEAAFRGFFRAGGLSREAFAQKPDDYRNLHFSVMASEGLAGPEFMSDAEIAVFTQAARVTGFTGGINYYRNITRNHHLLAGTPERIDVPCLMVEVPNDYYIPFDLVGEMPRFIPDLEVARIENAGHWVQQEKPEEVNRILVDWLTRRF
ncbi:alpha/beta fold hydrolase [Zavarzinia sp. CC-PAN008]|uniref:alpha/beta fold hydrolase n=1 Tax=Zavarzinia sp. CC-PAN008 TaxID=3243332 RepID=UPI003F749C7D